MKIIIILLSLTSFYSFSQRINWAEKIQTSCFIPDLMEKDASGDIFIGQRYIAKYNSAGNLLWQKTPPNYLDRIKIDASGNCFVMGCLSSSFSYDVNGTNFTLNPIGNSDFFLAKYGPNGNLIWAINLGSMNVSFSNYGNDLILDNFGNPIIKVSVDGTNGDVDMDPSNSTFNLTVTPYSSVIAKYSNTDGSLLFANLSENGLRLIPDALTNNFFGINNSKILKFNSNGILLSDNPIMIPSILQSGIKDLIFHDNSFYLITNRELLQLNYPASSNKLSFTNKVLKMSQSGILENEHSFYSYTLMWNSSYSTIKNTLQRILVSNNEIFVLYNQSGGTPINEIGIYKFDGTLNLTSTMPFYSNYGVGSNGLSINSFLINGNNYYLTGGLPVGVTVDFDPSSDTLSLTTPTYSCSGGSNTPGYGYINKYCFLPKKPTILGDTVLCAQVSSTFSSNNEIGITSNNWTLPSGWSGNSLSSTISVTPNNSQGTIFLSSQNSCGISLIDSIQIEIVQSIPNMPQNLTGLNTFCPNSQEIYSCLPSSNVTSYNWVLPTGWNGTSITNSIIANPTLQAHNGTIQVAAVNVCGSSSLATLNVVSEVNTNVIYDENTHTISSNTSNAIYQWVICDGVFTSVSGATTHSFTPHSSGNYALNIIQNGCTGISECISVGFAGINEKSTSSFSLFPNPATSFITLQFENQINSDFVSVYSISGQKVLHERIVADDNQFQVNTSHLQSGIYVVKVGDSRMKFIVE